MIRKKEVSYEIRVETNNKTASTVEINRKLYIPFGNFISKEEANDFRDCFLLKSYPTRKIETVRISKEIVEEVVEVI